MDTPEVPRPSPMSSEELRVRAEELRKRQEELEQQRTQAIRNNVTDREGLIGQVKQSDERLSAVRDVIGQYRVLEESGGQLSDQDRTLFRDMQDEEQRLVAFLNDANTQIGSLTASPGVMEKLQDAAGEEDRERTAKERLAELEREYLPRFEQLADEAWEQIDRLISEIPTSIAQHKREQEKLRKKLGPVVEETSRVSPIIQYVLSQPWERVSRDSLEALKKRFGAFKFKERKAVDQLFEYVSDFEELGNAAKTIDGLQRQRWEITSSAKETFYPRFKALIEEAKQRAGERGIPRELFDRCTLETYKIGRVVDRRIFSKLKARGPDGEMLADRDEYMEAKGKERTGGYRFSDDRIKSVSRFVWTMTTGHG